MQEEHILILFHLISSFKIYTTGLQYQAKISCDVIRIVLILTRVSLLVQHDEAPAEFNKALLVFVEEAVRAQAVAEHKVAVAA